LRLPSANLRDKVRGINAAASYTDCPLFVEVEIIPQQRSELFGLVVIVLGEAIASVVELVLAMLAQARSEVEGLDPAPKEAARHTEPVLVAVLLTIIAVRPVAAFVSVPRVEITRRADAVTSLVLASTRE
jgi:hypothetical protein